MKKILIFFVLIITMIGVSGCMNNIEYKKANDYEMEILNYLEEKYSEAFVIEKMVRQTDIGKSSVIMAKAYSEKYPKEYFDIVYHLSADDIDEKKEVIAFLKEIDEYDNSKLKSTVNVDDGYIEDNYCNIVLQNEFDKKRSISNAIYSKTIFETTNFYPSINGNDVTLDEYISSLPCPLYICTMIFVDEAKIIEKDILMKKWIDELLVKEAERQFIYIHFSDKNSEFIETEFTKHYDDVVMYFKNAEYVTEYENIFIKQGEIQSN